MESNNPLILIGKWIVGLPTTWTPEGSMWGKRKVPEMRSGIAGVYTYDVPLDPAGWGWGAWGRSRAGKEIPLSWPP